jgi:hypothetical protein
MSTSKKQPSVLGTKDPAFEQLLRAIVHDDRTGARALLKAEPRLATAATGEARLYEGNISHWLYRNDTALHLAAAGHRPQIVQILLAAGADVNAAANHRCGRPLHYTADGYLKNPAFDPVRQVKTIRLLLDAGADLHAADKNGATALHRAVRTRCAAAVECLLKAGADPNLRNRPGSTPFHLALENTGRGGSGDENAKAAQRRIVELLLEHGARADMKNGRGRSFASGKKMERPDEGR